MSTFLKVNNLCISAKTDEKILNIVSDVSFTLKKGELFAIVGESGSGKSITVLSLMGLLPKNFYISSGSVDFESKDLINIPANEKRNIIGSKISMIFQDPLTALNPLLTIGFQVSENLITHGKMKKKTALEESAKLLEQVGITNSKERLSSYPHQLSGGMRQRVMIASAISMKPELLIADEPTTALDVTVQASIMRLIKKLCKENNSSLILISHNLSLVKNTCSSVAVMYSGSIQESGLCETVFTNPIHPYTKMLISCLPKMDSSEKLMSIAGTPPTPSERPNGCSFNPRCPKATDICRKETPKLREVEKGHFVRCFNLEAKNV